jgi:chromosome segregation ATPase
MTINTTFLPPHTDPATITLAAQLLASLSDPSGTQARLQQLADATDALRAAAADHLAAKAQAEQAATKLASLEADKLALADQRAEHERAVVALAVTSEATAKRGRDLDDRARLVEAQAADVQRRIAAYDAKVKSFRDELLAG